LSELETACGLDKSTDAVERAEGKRRGNALRRLYDWVLHWAETPYGMPALFVLAFAESSFFPIPPDVLLIALAVAIPSKAFRYAAVCSVGSILGGMFGYYIGRELFDAIGRPVLEFYNYMDKFAYVQQKYGQNAFAFIAIAGFTPIPYKVFTIAAGVCHQEVSLGTLVIASAISRTARFMLVALLIFSFGPAIKRWIDRYFNLLSILFVVLIILGFAAVKIFH